MGYNAPPAADPSMMPAELWEVGPRGGSGDRIGTAWLKAAPFYPACIFIPDPRDGNASAWLFVRTSDRRFGIYERCVPSVAVAVEWAGNEPPPDGLRTGPCPPPLPHSPS